MPVPDERQQLIALKAIRNAFFALLACLFASIIYKIIKTDSLGWEFWAIISACFVILISRRVMGDIEEPKDVFGKPLPLGSNREDKRARKINYVLESVIFAGACTVMDVVIFLSGKEDGADIELTKLIFPDLSPTLTIVITAVIAFASAFAISYLFEYIIGEKFKVKKYNEICKRLDEESDDIE